MAAEALYAELHKDAPYHDGTFEAWADKRSRSHPYHYLDGVTIFAAPVDISPDDDFLSASPQKRSGEHGEGAEEAEGHR